jgi:hypothetical protein
MKSACAHAVIVAVRSEGLEADLTIAVPTWSLVVPGEGFECSLPSRGGGVEDFAPTSG